ncbi:MAG: LysM peptidoglycan-binding domain-containing protein [Verrucomicrobiota bacterium]
MKSRYMDTHGKISSKRDFWQMALGALMLALFFQPLSAEAIHNSILAESVLMVDPLTGKVLYRKNASTPRYPASTVKLLTALIVYEKTKLQGTVTVKPEDTKVEPSHIPLKVGEKVKVKDLVYSLLIGSDNDSGMALARHVSGSVANFAIEMNKRAQKLGCTNSNFTNPHGLPDAKQTVTAYDMMKIFQAVISVPELRDICKTQSFKLTTQARTQTVKNHNKLLTRYSGMGPAKTGWTYASQHTYAAEASKKGRPIHLIILKSKNKWSDAPILLNYGFKNLPDARSTAAKVTPVVPTTKFEDELAMPLPVKTQTETQTKKTASTSARISVAHTQAALKEAKAEIDPSSLIAYTVQKGDTLYSIGRRFDMHVTELAQINKLTNPNFIRVGSTLYVPGSGIR